MITTDATEVFSKRFYQHCYLKLFTCTREHSIRINRKKFGTGEISIATKTLIKHYTVRRQIIGEEALTGQGLIAPK